MNHNANLQSGAIGVVLHPYLDDLERFLKTQPQSHHCLAPAQRGRERLRKCKISIISGFPQAIGRPGGSGPSTTGCRFENRLAVDESATEPVRDNERLGTECKRWLLLRGGGFCGGVGVFLREALHATCGIDQLLFAGEEGVAIRANFDA